MKVRRRGVPTSLVICAGFIALGACGAGNATAGGAAKQGPTPSTADAADSQGHDLVPAGYGSLRQDDISVKVRLQTVLVRAIPLDESVIRLLSPDSYKALRELRDGGGRRDQIQRVASRLGEQDPSLWYVSYFGLQPDAQYVSGDMNIVSGGRDYRPIDVIPLTAGFGSQRVGQREVQSAIYIFDNGIDTDHPLTVTVQSARTTSWAQVIPLIERERALVRSRARGS
jgi:hypothetical protein